MKEPDIKILNELKIFIVGEFAKIHKDLKEINKSLQGNGKASMDVRMELVEKDKNWDIGIIAILATAFLTGLFAHYFSLIEKTMKSSIKSWLPFSFAAVEFPVRRFFCFCAGVVIRKDGVKVCAVAVVGDEGNLGGQAF